MCGVVFLESSEKKAKIGKATVAYQQKRQVGKHSNLEEKSLYDSVFVCCLLFRF